jgi:hypothetical protein
MSHRFLLLIGIAALLFVARPTEVSAQIGCKDCFLIFQGGTDPTWECHFVEGPGYLECTVGGTNCFLSGPCAPQFASVIEIEADGVLRSKAVDSWPTLVPIPIGDVPSDCELARRPRTYSIVDAVIVKRTTLRIVI